MHTILQLLFNWRDYHLHDFVAKRVRYSVPSPEDKEFRRKVSDERTVRLNALVKEVGATLEYLYDFGDGWLHTVQLEAIMLPEAGVQYPRCVAGARNGPPEDTGGPFAYAHFLQVLADPADEGHEEMLNWYGPFDGEAFSTAKINARLKKAFPQ